MANDEYHDIVGLSKNFRTLLGGGQKFYIDFYQRDYKWTTKQLSELIFDLTNRFLDNHGEHDERPREAVAKYDYYFLGSIVVSQKTMKDGVKKFIIDGQQRLTTITLLLIYLNNLQKERGNTDPLDDLIFSASFGKKTFNIDVDDPERKIVMESLFLNGKTDNNHNGDESLKNIIDRYHDIEDLFPAEIKDDTLLFFIDWLKERVFLVEITTYSDDDAYAIFETMNDRGLSLAPSDMLKGYLLANINQNDRRVAAIATWKKRTTELAELGERETEDFFKTWLRSQYADSIRDRARGATAKDFDLLGTQYHRWVRANANRVKIIKIG